MVALQYNIIEPAFDNQYTSDYRLSILIGGDSLSYLIVDTQNQILGFRSYAKTTADKSFNQFLQRILNSDNLLKQPFLSTHIAWYSPKFTLVPTALWDETQSEIYLQTIARLHTSERVQHHSITTNHSLKVLYAAEHTAFQYIQQQFPQAQIYHSFSGLLLYLLRSLPNSDELIATAHIHADSWTMTIIHNGKLLYHNIFRYKNSSDCLYYTLSVFKYLNLDPQKHSLFLSGGITEDSEIYQLLYKYIQKLVFIAAPSYYTYGAGFSKQVSSHFYLDLLSLYLVCE